MAVAAVSERLSQTSKGFLLCLLSEALRYVHDSLLVFEEGVTLSHFLLESHHDLAVFPSAQIVSLRGQRRIHVEEIYRYDFRDCACWSEISVFGASIVESSAGSVEDMIFRGCVYKASKCAGTRMDQKIQDDYW